MAMKPNNMIGRSLQSTKKPTKPVAPKTKPQNAYQKSMTAGMSYASAKNQIKELQKVVDKYNKKGQKDPEGMRGVFADKLTSAKSDASKSKRNAENAAAKVKPKPNKNVSFTYKPDKRG